MSTTLDQELAEAVAAWRAVETDVQRLCAAGAGITQAERAYCAERLLVTQAALINVLAAVLVAMRAERLIPDAP